MSDNNFNNQNQQPGYSNFNQYPQGTPVQPIYITANGVNTGAANKQKATSLGIWGLVLSILSPCCCFIPAFVGLGLSISGLKKNSKSVICIIALIFNLIVVGYVIYSIVYTLNHPEEMQQVMQQYNEMLQQAQSQAGGQSIPAGSLMTMIFR